MHNPGKPDIRFAAIEVFQRDVTDAGERPDPFAMVAKIKSRGPAPVHLWDPPFCGDLDMVIQRDGTWVHEGKPIRRQAMVALFASVLKKEADDFYLVTPVEKVRIQVEDCPFLITEMDVSKSNSQQQLTFHTNVGELVVANANHPLRVTEHGENQEPHPVLQVRNGLEGLISRAVFYRLVELAESARVGGQDRVGVYSAGEFFPLESV